MQQVLIGTFPSNGGDHPITFDPPFAKVPDLVVGFCHIDVRPGDSAMVRLDTQPVNVQTHSAVIRVQTWQNGYLFQANISWIAVGEKLG